MGKKFHGCGKPLTEEETDEGLDFIVTHTHPSSGSGGAGSASSSAAAPTHKSPPPAPVSSSTSASAPPAPPPPPPHSELPAIDLARMPAMRRAEDMEAPPGCTLRRYTPLSGKAYWHGELPPGKIFLLEGSRNSRRRYYGPGYRTSDKAKELVWQYLSQAHDSGALD